MLRLLLSVQFRSVQFSRSVVPTPCNPVNRSTPGLPVHHQLPEFTQTHIHRISDAIQQSHPLSSPSAPASNPSQHQSLFQWVNSSHQSCPTLSNPMDCSLPGSCIHGIFQARVLEWGAIAFSDPYMTTGKTIALTLWTFVGKVMSLLFNMLSMFVIAFSSKEHASYNFMAAVTIRNDFGAQENKVSHCFCCFPICIPWSDDTSCSDVTFYFIFFCTIRSLLWVLFL